MGQYHLRIAHNETGEVLLEHDTDVVMCVSDAENEINQFAAVKAGKGGALAVANASEDLIRQIRTTIDPDTWKDELYARRHNHPQQKVVYIAGRITGKPEYWEDYAEAAGDIEELGHIALNPADLPEGMTNPQYMRICLSMIDCAHAVLFLPDWEQSEGAKVERGYAIYLDKPTAYSIEQLKELL